MVLYINPARQEWHNLVNFIYPKPVFGKFKYRVQGKVYAESSEEFSKIYEQAIIWSKLS